jgi:hypothetical protein
MGAVPRVLLANAADRRGRSGGARTKSRLSGGSGKRPKQLAGSGSIQALPSVLNCRDRPRAIPEGKRAFKAPVAG